MRTPRVLRSMLQHTALLVLAGDDADRLSQVPAPGSVGGIAQRGLSPASRAPWTDAFTPSVSAHHGAWLLNAEYAECGALQRVLRVALTA